MYKDKKKGKKIEKWINRLTERQKGRKIYRNKDKKDKNIEKYKEKRKNIEKYKEKR